MKTVPNLIAAWIFFATTGTPLATIHYVDLQSSSPMPPYTNWATAATTIQNAVDAAGAGDDVVVTNGTYTSGGRTVYGTMTNRVAVTKPLTLRSVNGPQATIIQGHQVPELTNGDGAIRCVYLTNGASLIGFSLTNGATRDASQNASPVHEQSGGGVWCESTLAVVSNCVLGGNSASSHGGGVYGGSLDNCTLSGNSAREGGGAFACTLRNCELNNNLAYNVVYVGGNGGGAESSRLWGCTLSGNAAIGIIFYAGGSSGGSGGGCDNCVLSNCVLSTNSALNGGGASSSTVTKCALTSNFATYGGGAFSSTLCTSTLSSNLAGFGGGANGCKLDNCALIANFASAHPDGVSGADTGYGGAAFNCVLNNCTVSFNSAMGDPFNPFYSGYPGFGGGSCQGTLSNCIVYFNTATFGADNAGSSMDYCCTPELPAGGFGNITNAPLFVDLAGGNLRLQSNSPCINAGKNAYAPSGPDFDGNPRIVGGTVDIGAFEFQTSTSLISYAWLQQYGLPTDGSADLTDLDGDGMNNWQEWRTGTDPTNPSSVLKMLVPVRANHPSGIAVSWQSISGATYFLGRCTNLGIQAALSLLQTNIVGQPGTTTYTDTNALDAGPFFYRVGVRN